MVKRLFIVLIEQMDISKYLYHSGERIYGLRAYILFGRWIGDNEGFCAIKPRWGSNSGLPDQ